MRPRALSYYGGKQKTAPWIASLLPMRQAYVEPYAGMLSVLLARPKADAEIASDLDGNVWNWWRCVRERGCEMARRLDWTPIGRREFEAARRLLFETPHSSALDVDRAVAFQMYVGVGRDSQTRRGGQWCPTYTKRGLSAWRWGPERFRALRDRIEDVQLECRPAADVLAACASRADAVVYCDPPYPSAHVGYRHHKVDVPQLAELLRAQKGFCAVSGYGGEWDGLGWTRTERPTMSGAAVGRGGPLRRVEVLWTNG